MTKVNGKQSDTHMTELELMKFHFKRMWKDRENPATRYSLKQNLRAQRTEKNGSS